MNDIPEICGERAIGDCALLLMQSSSLAQDGIDDCLRLLGEAVGATRVVLFEIDSGNNYADAIYEWHHADRSPQRGARYKSSELTETFRVFNLGETVVAHQDGDSPYLGLQANMVTEDLALLVLTPIQRHQRTAWVSVFSWHGSSSEASKSRVDFCKRATKILDIGLLRIEEHEQSRKREKRLLHSQRLESIGLLAGGIAHDFNNVLQAVTGLSELLAAEEGSPDNLIAKQLIHVAERAAQITNRLLVFSRQEPRQESSLDISAALQSAFAFLKRTIPEDRELKLTIEAPQTHVRLSATDFEHAIINLCNNASAALRSGGCIELGCRNGEGSLTEIWVRDTGKGMSEDELAQAQQPFFTTKPAGEGTGLGLAMVDTMVQRAGGILQLESELGVGTCVTMQLPTTNAADPLVEQPASIVSGTETILVAEDDPVILRVNCSHLERAGFTPLGATNTDEALALFQEHKADIRMIVTDAIMPGGGGAVLYEAIHEQAPGLPFLFASGYDNGSLSSELLKQPNCRILAKPYQTKTMLRLVRSMLDAAPRA